LKDKAKDGLELIEAMHQKFGSKIEIMAGSGVNPGNALSLSKTGIENLHFTARKPSREKIIPGMGVNMITDEEKMRAISDLFA